MFCKGNGESLVARHTSLGWLLNHPLAHEWDPESIKKHERIMVTGVPREAPHFIDASYTSGHHLDSVFHS